MGHVALACCVCACRTNFCSICKVEKDVATAYMEATKYDIVAAVEEYVARHLLHPSQVSHNRTVSHC